MVVTAVLTDYSQHFQHRQQIESSLDNRMMMDTDAGQTSYKRHTDDDSDEAFLLHTSWMGWRHGVPQRSRRWSTLIGRYHLYIFIFIHQKAGSDKEQT